MPIKENSVRTTKKVSSVASQVLKKSSAPKQTKTFAGSALSNRRKK